MDSVIQSFRVLRERGETTAQEAARNHLDFLRQQNDLDEGKYTWKRWQEYDLRYAFFLAAASAPDDLHFYERNRQKNLTYYEKMKLFVDRSVIHTEHLGGQRVYDEMSVRLSQEAFELIRWDSSREKYLVDQQLLEHVRQMMTGPLPALEESTFNSDPGLLFQPRFNAPPRRPSVKPEWDNYLNKELARKFWEHTLQGIDDLVGKNKAVFFKNDQYERYR